MARNLTEALKAQVRDRANGLCEYCHAVEKWQFILQRPIPSISR